MHNPLVSICIPTFNGEEFIVNAMESAISQTYLNLEIIVSDDASIDGTLKLIETFKERTTIPIKMYYHQPNGIGANWNNCIINAKGEYIKFLFQDDILYRKCIEEMMKVIIKDENTGLVACKRDFLVEGKKDSVLNEWISTYQNLQANLNLPSSRVNILDKTILRNKNFINVPQNKIGEPTAVLFRKSVIIRIGYFREDLVQILDAEFYYRLIKYFKIAVINEELVAFRLHPMQATNINRKKAIIDYNEYDRILYNNFFWYLDRVQQKRLFKKFSLVGKILREFKKQ